MRALVVVIALLATGFDHAKHDKQVNQQLACANCHAVSKRGVLEGRPNHATCFGKCHGTAPVLPPKGKKLVVEPARASVCTTCHAQGTLETGIDKKAFAATLPPKPTRDFVLAVGHKRHADAACSQCHTKAVTQHQRCTSCHDGTKTTAMTFCNTCHLEADKTVPVAEARVLVRSAFSHAKHATRGSGGKCATCHANVTNNNDRELAHPTAKTCAIDGCHDAKVAFAPTEKCTRCHQDIPGGKFEVARPPGTFSHWLHYPYVAFVSCATCHAVEKSGEVGLASHAQCVGCHADDFGERRPKTCGACHDATEPWRKLLPDRPSLAKTEFGSSLDHAKHDAACTSCHSLTTEGQQMRPPRGHRSCMGKGCHAAVGGAAPLFGQCDGCHDLGLANRRATARETAPWSVREKFVHVKHERGVDGVALACTSCHVDMSASDVMSIATPPKPTCAKCHDGGAAFKLTGTGCARCHVKKVKRPGAP